MAKQVIFVCVAMVLWPELFRLMANAEHSNSSHYSLSLFTGCENCEVKNSLGSNEKRYRVNSAEFLAFVGKSPTNRGGKTFTEMKLVFNRTLLVHRKSTILCAKTFNPIVYNDTVDAALNDFIPIEAYHRLLLSNTQSRMLSCDGMKFNFGVPTYQLGLFVGVGTVYFVETGRCRGGTSFRHGKHRRERDGTLNFLKCKFS